MHGDGAIGNRNINITGNTFDHNYCPYMMNIAWADTVRISGNIIDAPSPLRLSSPGHVISLHDARNITLKGNTYTNPGLSVANPVFVGKNVERLVGRDQSGMRELRR